MATSNPLINQNMSSKKTITLSYHDTTNDVRVKDIKASIVAYPVNPDLATETENQQEIIIDSIDVNKDFDSSTLRIEDKGKTYFSPQVGSKLTLKDLKDEEIDWLTNAGVATITLTIFE